MKKTVSQHLSLWLFTIVSSTVCGQALQVPFEVSTPMFWIEAQQTQGKLILKEHITSQVLAEKPWYASREMNHNPSFPIDESLPPIQFHLPQDVAEQYSIFVVYKTEHQQHEQNLWTLSKEKIQLPLIVATNQRLADYTGGQFRSYPERITSQRVKIHYYQHYKKLEAPTGEVGDSTIYTLNLGKRTEGLPPLNFKGDISEVIIYNRVLSAVEMQQIASYLAIKYGVSLHQMAFKNYYDRKGDIIWDYKKHEAYNQNITAVGKTNLGNLRQLKSTNSNDEQVIAMELQSAGGQELPDDFFVFWSDNGKALKVAKQREGQPKGIARVWRMDTPNKVKALNMTSQLSAISPSKSSQSSQETPDYYWLVMNTEDTFSPEGTQYFRLGEVESADNVTVDNILSPSVSSAEGQYFTIWQAPEMFGHLDLVAGRCKDNQDGKVRFNMIGGVAPFQIQVKNLDRPSVSWQWKATSHRDEKPLHLPSGKYAYSITDAENHQYKGEVYISDEDAPLPDLNQEYLIKTPILLNPSRALPQEHYRYEWYQDGVLVSENPTYLLHQSGNYELRLRNASECQSVTAFKAFTTDVDSIEPKIVVYPNPSKDGYFSVAASFPKAVSGSLQIYSNEGKLITQQAYHNETQWLYEGSLSVSGVYYIKIQSSLGTETKKLIIHK